MSSNNDYEFKEIPKEYRYLREPPLKHILDRIKSRERKVKIKKRPPLDIVLRFRILERDNFTCQYCGRKPPDVKLHVDHIFPKSKGGTDSDSNLRTSCQECNLGKKARILKNNIRKTISREYYDGYINGYSAALKLLEDSCDISFDFDVLTRESMIISEYLDKEG